MIEHTNSDVNGDLTPGTGNQQTLIQRSLPGNLQEGEMTYQFSSNQFENNLNGMSAQSAYAQMPSAGLPSNATWTQVNTANTNDNGPNGNGDTSGGYLDLGSTGAGAAANSVYWASTWVWIPPWSPFNWQAPKTLNEPWANYTYGPFRVSQNPSQNSSSQYNKDRIWVNGQLIPAAIFSTASDLEVNETHSFPYFGNNFSGEGNSLATDDLENLNLQEGWNHLVFQFDTSSTGQSINTFHNQELAFKFGINSQFYTTGSGVISQATEPTNLSQAPTTGTPQQFISQYSVLTTSNTPGVIVAPFTGETFHADVYARLRNGENPSGASMAMYQISQSPLNTGAYTAIRGLDFLGSGLNVDRQGDLFEGCITQGVCGINSQWGEPSYAVGATVQTGQGSIGTGGFQGQVAYPTGSSATPYAVASGDFNGDGNPDMVVVNYASSGTISILLNNGNGTFQNTATYSVGSNPAGIAVSDFNGDGIQDLAVTNSGSSTVSILLGNGSGGKGNGTFQLFQTYSVSMAPFGIVAGKFDTSQNNYIDLAITHMLGNVTMLLGNGDGTFQVKSTTYTVGSTPRSIVAGDFSSDGNLDLAVANYSYSSGTVSVLLGNGDGTFQAQKSYNVGTHPYSITADHFAGQANPLDLAVANYGSSNVSVLMGNGDGTFQTAVPYNVGSNPEAVISNDFNGDGNPDLAVANYGSNTVSVLTGNGDGTFQTQTTYPVGTEPNSLVAADFNGDGNTDLATANYGSSIGGSSSTVSVLLESTPDANALNFSAMGWTNNVAPKPDCVITPGTPVTFSVPNTTSQLPAERQRQRLPVFWRLLLADLLPRPDRHGRHVRRLLGLKLPVAIQSCDLHRLDQPI